MPQITVIVPNFNGMKYLPCLLDSLKKQTDQDFHLILVDNGSSDQSVSFVGAARPETEIICLGENFGFSRAVNLGILASQTPYVLLLNNDIEASSDFIRQMREAMQRHPNAFSCQARMMSFASREKIDDAGNLYCALGWAFARGKGQEAGKWLREDQIFAACAGAAIYRRDWFKEIGLFDEEHFAYLEDVDLGYRARLCGRENWYAPKAVVYHVGSGTTGSRYNQFKTRYSSRNNVYMAYKNMPLPQLVLNLPLLTLGFAIKLAFFLPKGMGREYLAGIWNGLCLCRREKKFPYRKGRGFRYVQIQFELWGNTVRRFFS